MGWQVLICRPSEWTGGDRVAIWRQLRRCGALSLGNGTWVLGDDEAGRHRADEVDEFVHRRRCHLLRFVVPDADPRSSELEAMVHSALDREWDRLGVALDTAEQAIRGPGATGQVLDLMEDIRRGYLDVVSRYAREDPTGREVVHRLSSLVWAMEPAARAEANWLREQPPRVRLLTDGSPGGSGPNWVELQPFPGFGWELEFRAFEARTYLPSSARPELRHGLFVVRCAPEDLDAAIEGIESRVLVFSSWMGAHARTAGADARPAAIA
jgi:hypothetical protein